MKVFYFVLIASLGGAREAVYEDEALSFKLEPSDEDLWKHLDNRVFEPSFVGKIVDQIQHHIPRLAAAKEVVLSHRLPPLKIGDLLRLKSDAWSALWENIKYIPLFLMDYVNIYLEIISDVQIFRPWFNEIKHQFSLHNYDVTYLEFEEIVE